MYDRKPQTGEVGRGRASEPPAPAQPTAGLTPVPAQTPAATAITCVTCGYNLTGVTIGGTCPECGSLVDPSLSATSRPASGLAIASLVLGICSTVTSIMVCMCVGPLISVPCGAAGLICWHLARAPIREGRVSASSSGMNTAGLVTSIIGLAISLGFIGLFAFAIATG